MRRPVLVGITALAIVAGLASRAHAQVQPRAAGGWDLRAGWEGAYASSSHEDAGFISIASAFYGAGHLEMSWFGDVRIGHEYGGGSMQKYLAGVRFTNTSLFAWPAYLDVGVGAVHYTGGTDFHMEPAAGLVFPWGNERCRFFAQIGMPIYFFPGNTEFGVSGKAGLKLTF